MKSSNNIPRPISLKDFARIMGVNETAIQLAIEEGKISAFVKIGDEYQISNADTATNDYLELLQSSIKELLDSLDEVENLLRSMKIPNEIIFSLFGENRTLEQLHRSENSKYLIALFSGIPKYLHEGLPEKKKRTAQWKLIKARLKIYRAAKAYKNAWLNLIAVEYMIFIHGKICNFDLSGKNK
jgi:hypothetical protein